MHIWTALGAREAALLAVLLLGAGPASLLSSRFDTAARVALAPILGFCVGTCVTTRAPRVRSRPRDPASAPSSPASYLGIYERVLAPVCFRRCSLIELGVWGGGSLIMWRDGMPRATTIGVDLEPSDLDLGARVKLIRGDQTDGELLRWVREQHAPGGFDVVIDDASISGSRRRVRYSGFTGITCGLAASTALRIGELDTSRRGPDGAELTETVGSGELDRLPSCAELGRDGPVHLASHDAGMVGLVKRLVDHVAAGTTLAHLAAEHVDDALPIAALEVCDGVVVLRKP
jgi:hypothetical protein